MSRTRRWCALRSFRYDRWCMALIWQWLACWQVDIFTVILLTGLTAEARSGVSHRNIFRKAKTGVSGKTDRPHLYETVGTTSNDDGEWAERQCLRLSKTDERTHREREREWAMEIRAGDKHSGGWGGRCDETG